MSSELCTFHAIGAEVDFVEPMRGLLRGFREGRFADSSRQWEDAAIREHLGTHYAAWERVFPTFPRCRWKRRSIAWEAKRGERDAYLRGLVADLVPCGGHELRLIHNPATVFGRHARFLAKALPNHEVVGTDIDARWERVYRALFFWRFLGLDNYRFERENVFDPVPGRRPVAVTFFGACGSITDGGIDAGIASGAPFLAFRSCCHDNIAGNTEIVRHRGRPINDFFALKNFTFAREKQKGRGFYFDERYGSGAYPRSRAARELADAATFLTLARSSPDSDICRSIIDLDRCLYLREHGYDVLYREELFFAHRRAPASCGATPSAARSSTGRPAHE